MKDNLSTKYLKYFILFIVLLFNAFGCSSNIMQDSIISSMKQTLNLHFNESKSGKINKEQFYLDGALLFGTKPGDYDFRKLYYNFSDNSYFNLKYKEEFEYYNQKDIFGNEISKGTPGYMGQVVKVPNETIKLDCVISFSYGNYTISNNLKIELYGGSQSTAFAEGWIQIDSNHYKYSSNYTLTDNIDRPTQKNTTSGEINLENCILDYRTKTDRYVNGLFSYTSLSCSFHYNGITKTMDISDNTNSNNIKTKSIFLGTLYNSAYYDNDKNDGWDWKILNYVLKALKLFDKLLIESGKSVYVSALYTNGNYSTNYLFGLS